MSSPFLEVILGESHWAIHLSLPVRWTHLFRARVNNLSWVWAKESLRFLFVGLVFSLLLLPSSSVIFLCRLFYMNFTLLSFSICSTSLLSLSVSSHSFPSALSCTSLGFRLFRQISYCTSPVKRVREREGKRELSFTSLHPAQGNRWIPWQTVLMLAYCASIAGQRLCWFIHLRYTWSCNHCRLSRCDASANIGCITQRGNLWERQKGLYAMCWGLVWQTEVCHHFKMKRIRLYKSDSCNRSGSSAQNYCYPVKFNNVTKLRLRNYCKRNCSLLPKDSPSYSNYFSFEGKLFNISCLSSPLMGSANKTKSFEAVVLFHLK